GRSPETVTTLEAIPFLPISFYKSHSVKTGDFEPQTIFKSSGTTGATTSQHQVKDLLLYERSFLTCFTQFFGDPQQYCVLGLLPSYLEQGSSSLVYMVDNLVRKSSHPLSGFYLYDHGKLKETVQQLEAEKQPAILFGVTYALLDFADEYAMPLCSTTLVETGGMKGRKKELTKAELYQRLQLAFSQEVIHSEYGMTELLSQAYAVNGRYHCPPWMKVLLRDETDPFSLGGSSGAINVIDLANVWSCSFIATEDLGRLHPDGSFEVMGRMDNSDIRGCSQLAL
ncbi:MAG TPA: acyl transferase, partial [Flavisolibacter sp.]|nr:acyl transferase [Flavisolibacter sp.]